MIPKGWKSVKLADVATVRRGAGSQYLKYVDGPEKGVRLIRIGDFLSDDKVYVEHTRHIDRFILSKGDILIAGTGATAGIVFEIPDEFDGLAFSYNAPLIQVSPLASKEYLFKVLSSQIVIQQQNALFTGNAQPFLDTKAISGFRIPLPPLPEQRRIAEILGTWDRAIETVKALISNGHSQKKALMQSLLTGKHRLLGFSKAWTEKPLDAIFHFLKGQGLSKDSVVTDGRFLCILYGELYTRYPEVIGEVVGRTNANDGALSRSGDVLIPASTTTTGIDLANATALLQSDIRLSGDINILRPKDAAQSAPFYAYLLTHIKKLEIASRAQGSTIVHLYGSALKPLTVRVPEPAEQHAIAAIVMDADKGIVTLQSQLIALRQEKSALMQQLLTSKRRVKLDVDELAHA